MQHPGKQLLRPAGEVFQVAAFCRAQQIDEREAGEADGTLRAPVRNPDEPDETAAPLPLGAASMTARVHALRFARACVSSFAAGNIPRLCRF